MGLFLPLALGALGAFGGARQANQQKQNDFQNMMANAEAIRMSPWTKMNVGMMQGQPRQSGLMAALGGGLSGAIKGAAFDKAISPGAAAKPSMYSGMASPSLMGEEDPFMKSPWLGIRSGSIA